MSITPEEIQEQRHRSAVEHAFHVWINDRQQERRDQDLPWESDLYEWKSALLEIERLPGWLRKARTGTLRTVHRQCSHTAPEEIMENRLICALGQDVTACPILASLYANFAAQKEADQRIASERFPARLVDDDADVLAARVCTWHIFTTKFRQGGIGIDTSEGYVQDESDRRYWRNVYDSLAGGDPGEGLL